jgi:hypothetical protein
VDGLAEPVSFVVPIDGPSTNSLRELLRRS